MPWTVEQRKAYQAKWRARNPTYQQDLKKYRRTVEGQWRAEFLEKARGRSGRLSPLVLERDHPSRGVPVGE